MTEFHLPAISGILYESPRGLRAPPEWLEQRRPRVFSFSMVSACGRRGPIVKRMEWHPTTIEMPLFGVQLEVPAPGPRICGACVVQWDAAEQRGDIAVLYKPNRKAAWKGGGASLCTGPFWNRDPNDPNLKIMIMVRREVAPKPKRGRKRERKAEAGDN